MTGAKAIALTTRAEWQPPGDPTRPMPPDEVPEPAEPPSDPGAPPETPPDRPEEVPPEPEPR